MHRYDDELYYSNDHSIFSYFLGVKGEYSFLNHFLVHPGLRFTSKGFGYKYNLSGSGTEVSGVYRINYLELPLSLSLDLGKPEGFLFTEGIYGGVGLFGRETNMLDGEVKDKSKIEFSSLIDYNHVPVIFGNSDFLIDYERNFTVTPFEFGWVLGVGYRKKQILVDVHWNQTCGSVHPNYPK